MSAPIGPGDWVECVNNGPIDGAPATPELTVGAVYIVTEVLPPDLPPKADLIERLLEPVPDDAVLV